MAICKSNYNLSGWLVEYHSWHWIFLINLPVGIFSLSNDVDGIFMCVRAIDPMR